MKLIESPHKAVSVWLLGLATLVIGLSQMVPQLKGLLPDQWLAWLVPAALVARLIKQTLSPPDSGTPGAGSPLALLLVLGCLCSGASTGCTKQQADKAADQLGCVIKTEVKEALRLYVAECIDIDAEPTGKCTDEQLDAIMAPTDAKGEACLN